MKTSKSGTEVGCGLTVPTVRRELEKVVQKLFGCSAEKARHMRMEQNF